MPADHCFLLSLALGRSSEQPHLRHFEALGGFVAEQFMQTDLSRSLLSASLKRAIIFPRVAEQVGNINKITHARGTG